MAVPEEENKVTNRHRHLPAGPFSQAFPGREGLEWGCTTLHLYLGGLPRHAKSQEGMKSAQLVSQGARLDSAIFYPREGEENF